MNIDGIINIAQRIHDDENWNLGTGSTREYRIKFWERVMGCVYWGHPTYNATPDTKWHCKRATSTSLPSDDVALSLPTRDFWDCIESAGGPNYQIKAHYGGILDPAQPEYVPPKPEGGGVGPTHSTSLGASLFYLPRAFKENWEELKPNLEWIKTKLNADYIRAFWSIGALQNPNDVWIQAGSSYRWPDLVDICRRATEMVVNEFGLRVQWTITGGPEGFENDSLLAENCGRFLDTIEGLEAHIHLVECMNEYAVNNGGDKDAGRHILRNMARTLAPHLNGIPFSLSSPDSCMGTDPNNPEIAAETSKMYDGLPLQVNAGTPHWSRHSGHPEWHRPPNMGPSTPDHLYGNEGEGPGSSVVEERDENVISGHYQSAINANYAGWLLHTDCLIWSNRIPNHYKIPDGGGAIPRGQWRFLRDVPNIMAISQRLSEVRATGSGGGGGNGGGGGGGGTTTPGPDKLLSGAILGPGQSLISPNHKASLQNQLDGNLVSYADLGDGQGNHPVWASGTHQPPGYEPGNLKMQEDGNLVLSDKHGRPIWASHTDGNPGAMIQVQDDGFVVMYKNGQPLWRRPE